LVAINSPGKDFNQMRTHESRFFLILFLLLSSCLLLAQSDLLTAAGANRNRAQAKPASGEWYSPTQVSLTIQAEGITNTATYEIISDQELKITTNAKDKRGQQETSEIMFVNGRSHWMLRPDENWRRPR
jgi:lipocalin